MTDDNSFQVTPQDVRAQQFERGLRGYATEQVEAFKLRVADELERLLRDRVQAEERLRHLGEQLKQYRDRERAMNDALIAAQQLRVDIQAQADREAGVALKEARLEAERLLEAARAEEAQVHQRTEAVNRQYAAYLHALRTLLDRHQAELAGLESRLPEAARA